MIQWMALATSTNMVQWATTTIDFGLYVFGIGNIYYPHEVTDFQLPKIHMVKHIKVPPDLRLKWE